MIFVIQLEITNNNENEIKFGSGLGINGNEFIVVDGYDSEGSIYENIVDVNISESYNGITIAPGETATYNVYFHVLEEFSSVKTKYILELAFINALSGDSYIYFEFK